jgi:hypothetical protein
VLESPGCRGRLALLAAGVEPAVNRTDRMVGGRNPFYSFFGEVPLGPLRPEDARQMVVSIGGQMGVGYTAEALELLVTVGGGHPFLTRQVCSRAVAGLERPATIDAPQAAGAVDEYLRHPQNHLAESLWQVESGGPPTEEAALLTALAADQPQLEERLIPADRSLAEQRAARLALERLRDQSLLRQTDGGWELTIPLYRRWIRRYVLQLSEK